MFVLPLKNWNVYVLLDVRASLEKLECLCIIGL